jgi:antitoxin (DNA-binding transcriptional repressor) of toxin-antitoxin stability system
VLELVELCRRPADVVRRSRSSTVLLRDGAATFKLTPRPAWRTEAVLLRALGRLAAERGQWSAAALLLLGSTADIPPSPALPAWAISDVPGQWATVLDAAAAGEPFAITSRGVPVSVLRSAEAAQRDAGLVDHYRNIVRVLTSQVAAAEAGSVPLRDWLAVSPYPWLSLLPPQDVEDFVSESVSALADAVRAGDVDVVDMCLSAWRAACDTRRDAGPAVEAASGAPEAGHRCGLAPDQA